MNCCCSQDEHDKSTLKIPLLEDISGKCFATIQITWCVVSLLRNCTWSTSWGKCPKGSEDSLNQCPISIGIDLYWLASRLRSITQILLALIEGVLMGGGAFTVNQLNFAVCQFSSISPILISPFGTSDSFLIKNLASQKNACSSLIYGPIFPNLTCPWN